jgi:iron only hydrogenase large subunit-like protein
MREFGKYNDDDEDYDGREVEPVILTHLEQLKQILEEADFDYKETSDEDYDTILKVKVGVTLGFDEDGNLTGMDKL